MFVSIVNSLTRAWTVIRVTDRAVVKGVEAVADFVERTAAGRDESLQISGVELHRP